MKIFDVLSLGDNGIFGSLSEYQKLQLSWAHGIASVTGLRLTNSQSGLGSLGTILAEPAKFIPLYLVEKTFPLLKKVLKLGIQKVAIF